MVWEVEALRERASPRDSHPGAAVLTTLSPGSPSSAGAAPVAVAPSAPNVFHVDPQATASAWSADDTILFVTATSAGYRRALTEALRQLVARFGQGVVIAANRPSSLLRDTLEAEGVPTAGLHFIDCVSTAAGLPARSEPNVQHVESAALLEKIALRAEHALRRLSGPRFLLVDSVCALALYNGPAPVAEFAHALVNRLRGQRTAGALLLIEREGNAAVQDAVRPLCDGSLRL